MVSVYRRNSLLYIFNQKPEFLVVDNLVCNSKLKARSRKPQTTQIYLHTFTFHSNSTKIFPTYFPRFKEQPAFLL